MQIVVLGAGLVGSAMVKDLAADRPFTVTAVDASGAALDRVSGLERVITRQADCSSRATVQEVISGADLVICAVPGFMGFETLKSVIEAGKDVVDISFFPEDPFRLDDLARRNDVTAVVDCGVAPGLSNIMAGHVELEFDTVTRFLCYVGGLPAEPKWPYGYRSVFSPIDVIEEYTRPARYVEGGKPVVVEALSGIEPLDFPGVGRLEAFNSDGLRSLARTLDAPDMKEMTLRWPGHAELMRVFRETGFFGKDPIDVRGLAGGTGPVRVAPLDVVSNLLFEAWQMQKGEEDFTAMRVVLEGRLDGARLRRTYDLLDRFDRATGVTSMARTTGYTATLVARMVAGGLFTRKGVSPPEFVGRTEGCWRALMDGYAQRGISLSSSTETL